jgi:RecB family exonuclease
MNLSYSAISTYQKCPLQYRFRYVDGVPSEPSPSLSFGSSIHEALRWFYAVPTPDPSSLEDLLLYLEECWISDGYLDPAEEARYFCQAKSTLELYYRHYAEGFRLPAALEHKFKVDLGFCTLTGVIDRLDKDPDGGFEIIDYKTSRRLPPARRLASDLQLPLYHIATERIWGVSPEKVTFHYLLINHRHSFTVTDERLRHTLSEVERSASLIECGRFESTRNNLCPWCDYLRLCPAWDGKPPPARRAEPPPLHVGQAVDELIGAHRSVSSALSRVEGLNQIIKSYLDENRLQTVGGSRGVAILDQDGSISLEESHG